MATIRRVQLFIVLCFIPSTFLHSQTKAEYDSAYDRRLDVAWEDVARYNSQPKDRRNSIDPQSEYAPEFLSYYIQHRQTTVGYKAIQTSFMMWGNLGDVESTRQALRFIQTDSDLWPLLLNSIATAYGRQKRWSQYVHLLDSLSHVLTQPKSLAQVYLALGEDQVYRPNDSLARSSFRKVLQLDAASYQKEDALHGLYEIDSLTIGSLAPEFSGVSIKGQPIRLSDLKGKNVLLEFTGTWCGPCQGELPFLKEAYSKYSSPQLAFVAISMDDSAATVERYTASKKIPWPTILAPERNDNLAVKRYNAYGIPRIFLIDAQGRIRAKNLRGADISNAIVKLTSK